MDSSVDPSTAVAHPPENGAPVSKIESKPSPEAPLPPPPASTESRPQASDPPPTVHKSVTWSADLAREGPPPPYEATAAGGTTQEAPNPYITSSLKATDSSSAKKTMETVKNVMSNWGKKIGDSAKKAEDLSRNTWQHLKTGPSFAEAAMGRIAQGTKLIAEGGSEKIFLQTFDTLPDEKLRNSFACFLSTSAGPVMGVLYLSTEKLAFCSDTPLSYKVGDKTEWSYYKVVIPLHQLRAANSSVNRTNSAEKYIQIVSVDNHEFWFMGFLNYNNAVNSLQESVRQVHDSQA